MHRCRSLRVRRRGLASSANTWSHSLERGQATVEVAVVVIVVMTVVMAVLQILVVARDATSLTAAARAGARQAIVGGSEADIVAAAQRERRLDRSRLSVRRSGGTASGDLATITVTYSSPTEVPLVGRLVGDVTLTEEFVVRIE